MMLVHKQPPHNFPLSPAFHHRRHPSAPPAVVVQPTRTPGLLSLSKPQPQRSPRPRSAKPEQQRPRQPSPAAAEDPSSDPFLVSRPTGKPPRRRHPSSTTQPLSIPPAPAPAPTPTKPLSRSVPLPRHRPTKRTLLPPFEFPICDDLTDAGDLSDAAPTTPTRTRTKRPANPKSLPQFTPTPTKHVRPQRNHRRAPSDSLMVFHMSSDESGPESSGPSSSRSTSDDEALRTLLKNLAVQRKDIMKTPPPQRQREREAALEQQALQQQGQQGQGQAYFASSLFQNSPSPDELPDPMLF